MVKPTKPFTVLIAWFCGILAVALLFGWEPKKTNDAQQPAPSTPSAIVTAPSSPTLSKPPKRVGRRIEQEMSRKTFSGTWPLVMDSATITCRPYEPDNRYAMVTVVSSTGEYALNGFSTAHDRLPDIEPIWLQDESNPPARIGIGDLINAALALCKDAGLTR